MSPAFHLFFFFDKNIHRCWMKREQKNWEEWENSIPLGFLSLLLFLSSCFASSFFPELFPSSKVRLQKQAKKNWIRCERTEGKHTALFKRFYSNFTMTTGRWYTLQIYAEKLLLIVHLNLSKKKNSGTRLSAYIYIILEF